MCLRKCKLKGNNLVHKPVLAKHNCGWWLRDNHRRPFPTRRLWHSTASYHARTSLDLQTTAELIWHKSCHLTSVVVRIHRERLYHDAKVTSSSSRCRRTRCCFQRCSSQRLFARRVV